MHQYEKLQLWKRGIALAAHLLRRARAAGGAWGERALWEQITRAATSIPTNVAEGAQRGSNREFARFLGIATGSAAELHSLIYLAAEGGSLGRSEAQTLAGEAQQLRRMAAALRARAEGSRRESTERRAERVRRRI